MTKAEYLHFRDQYIPAITRIVFVLESPPASGRYFYNPEGPLSEALFRAMMQDVLKITPASREIGLKEFAARGFFLVDATYTPVNRLREQQREATILRDFPFLVEDLQKYVKPQTGIVLVKANVCRLLEKKLVLAGFNVLNEGTTIPFPGTGQQKNFTKAAKKILGA